MLFLWTYFFGRMKLFMYENIFKGDSAASIIEFVMNVESENSDKISEMIRNDVDMVWDIANTLFNLKGIVEDADVISDIDKVWSLVLLLHKKLLMLDQQNNQNSELFEKLYDDKKIVFHLLNENKQVLS